MPLGKGQRKIVRVMGFIALAVLVLFLALPLWFPWILKPLAAKAGVRYAKYERLGYAHFALDELTFTNRTTRLRVAQLKGVVPPVWLWHLASGNRSSQRLFVEAANWELEVLPRQTTKAKAPSSAHEELQRLIAIRRQLRRWLPTARLSNGTLRIGETSLAVRDLVWENGNLRARAAVFIRGQEAVLSGELSGSEPLNLRLRSEALHLDSDVKLFTSAAGFEIQSTNFWWTNRIDVIAHFGSSGLLPETAGLKANSFRFPAAAVRLPGYATINGSLVANWQNGKFVLTLNGRGEPLSSQTNLPPVDFALHSIGDTNSATIQTAEVSSPWVRIQLSREASIWFRGRPLRDPVPLTVTSDLDKQPWLPLNGVLKGRAMLTPIESKLVRADMELFGTEIGTDAVKAKTLSLEAQCYWPWLEVTNARATFEDGSLALATAKMDLENKLFSAGTLAFNGPLVRHWLPVGYSYEGLSLVAHFEGPMNELRHTGNLDATNVASPYLLPVSLHADWRGRQEKLEGFKAVVSSGSSSLSANGSLSLAPDQAELRLSSISLSTNRQPFMECTQPCLISFHYPTSQKSWQLGLGILDLAGTGGNLSAEAVIDWPRDGALHLSAQNLASTNFAGFVKATLPEINVHSLNASASWTNSPAKFEVEFSATGKVQRYEVASTNQTAQAEPSSGIVKDEQGRSRNRLTGQSLLTTPLSCEAKMAGDESGITVSNVVVRTAQADELAIQGFIPVAINPANATNLIDFLGKNPIQLNASIKPQAFIWDEIEDLTGIILIEPNLNVALSGNWDALEGQVRLSAQELELQNPPSPMPILSDLRVEVRLDQKSARITEARLLVQGQPATLAGQMPLGQGFWNGLKERQPLDWEQATAQLTIENAQISAFEPLFPDLVAPQGTLSVDFSLNRGGKVDGTMVIAHARTRPLGEFGSLRDINVTLRCSESALRLEQASAKLSSADLVLAGGAYLHGTDWLKGAIPPFELSLKGTQVPLVHRPDLIVRSDLLLSISKTNNAPPLISGLAHLRDSFYLSDLSALVPGKVAKPSARPPYFSIEEPSLADWRLAITVEGSRFMRVRSSLFDGEISANVNLQGTLKDPIALGNLRVDSGLVRFPFANLQVQQGLVNLTSESPYHPDLLVSATSKQFGYDIRMEVSGPVDAPIVQFTSNPPLSSEQIVLLVSSGQMPQAGYSLTPQQRAQTVALFLGRDVLSKLGFGDQPEQRLTIRTGEQISDQGKPTYNVEFKLSDHWALTGEYDRFSDYNFGFKWRIYSR